MSRTKRALIVSHACVLPANQSVFASLGELGWAVDIVVPDHWEHEYASDAVQAMKHPALLGGFHRRRIALAGQPQRHFYVGGCNALLRQLKPDVVFLEEETFSIPALQWGLACWRQRVPFGVQAAENLDLPLPRMARAWRAWTLRHAAFVAARSPTAKALAERWGARNEVEVVPHAVPPWSDIPAREHADVFTIGYAGRLVDEKGLFDLVDAARLLPVPVRLLLAGNGPLRESLAPAAGGNLTVDIASNMKHEDMAGAFAAMDVLVLPSRTTPTWVEQFGRVLVEALWCGVPVIGSSSGEIPWVIEVTGGGVVFPEGDVQALARALEELRTQPDERARLAETGRKEVERMFSVKAAAELLDALLSDTLRRSLGVPTPRR